jgi:spore germination protein GerM
VNRRTAVIIVLAAALVGVATWAVVRFTAPPATAPAAAAPGSQPAGATRRITATLFYVAADGLRLSPVQREVPFGDTPGDQIRRLLDAQLAPAPEGFTTAMPPGTAVRGVFVSEQGEVFVDFNAELRRAHPGGSLNEIFTVYTIVSTITANIPAVQAVQILVDGHEVDTLAGHVDLRRPLPRAQQWLEPPAAAQQASEPRAAAPDAR